jgi:predicted PurR-regulated permease PerM
MSDSVPAEPDWPPASQPDQGGSRVAIAAGLIIAAVVICALYFAREVLIPITLAALLTFILAPFVNVMRRVYIPRVPAIVAAVLLGLAIIIGVATLIGTQIADLAGQLPEYQVTIETKLSHVRDTVLSPLMRAAARFESQSQQNGDNSAAEPGSNPGETAPQPIPVQVQQPPLSPLQIGERVIAPILHPVATIVIMLVVTIFALLYKEDLRDRAIRLFGSGDLSRTTKAMDDAANRLSRYFLTQLAINCAFGVVVAIGTYLIGVPHPILWGVLGAVLRFVPYVGAWLAAALPVLVAAATGPGWAMALMTAGLYAVTEFFAGQFLEPFLYGHSTGLSPIAVVIAAIFWAWLWGPIGLIISTPLTLCAMVIGSHFEQLSFINVLLGTQPALTPSETLYQRLLAGDLDEAQEQAEEFLAEHDLVSYYDEIVIPALQLASADVSLGRITTAAVGQLRSHFEEFAELALEAAERKTTLAPDSPELGRISASNQVLCLPGRGPFDQIATLLLSQLFRQRGVEATNGLHEAASRRKVGSLELKNIAAVSVLYLELSGTPAHVRFLIRRLKERNSQTKLILGLLQKDSTATPEQTAKLGADEYVSSLERAVSAAASFLTHSRQTTSVN